MAHTFEPVRRVPLYLKVYKTIEDGIVSGRLPEGEALPTEAELCDQLGVTRSSVREGIRLLEQAGLVERGSHKRLIVKRPQSGDVAAAASKALALGGVTFQEVWQALSVMYPSAARLAADGLSEQVVHELDVNTKALSEVPPKAHDEIVAGAVDFFQIIAAGVENRVLLSMLQSLNLLIEASLRQVIASNPRAKSRILKAQTEILNAIKSRDTTEAATWMAKHINDLKRGYDVAGIDLSRAVI